MIEYYFEETLRALIAHEAKTDFVSIYSHQDGQWVASPLPFEKLSKDYALKEITRTEAGRRTNGIFPTALFAHYRQLLEKKKER